LATAAANKKTTEGLAESVKFPRWTMLLFAREQGITPRAYRLMDAPQQAALG
jgi:hypothetical protein